MSIIDCRGGFSPPIPQAKCERRRAKAHPTSLYANVVINDYDLRSFGKQGAYNMTNQTFPTTKALQSNAYHNFSFLISHFSFENLFRRFS